MFSGTDSSMASLLSSPKKLLSSSALRVTQKGFSFINNAISAAKDISVGYEGWFPFFLSIWLRF